MEVFDDFISRSKLINLPIHKRKFTWSRMGVAMMSRFDKFLINEKRLRMWPASTQWALDKKYLITVLFFYVKMCKNGDQFVSYVKLLEGFRRLS